MNNQDDFKKDEQLARYIYEGKLEGHRQIAPDIVKRIGSDAPKMKQMQMQQGQIDVALQRVDDMEKVIERRWNPAMKTWCIAFIIALGAVTFSTGFQTILKKQGSIFATGGAALVGAMLTWLVDDRATKFLGKYRTRKDSEMAIAGILQQHQQHKPQTSIVDAYYDGQAALVRQVERDRLMSDDRLDFGMAMGATALEAGVSFIVVSATGGLVLGLMSAALPVSVIWLAATFQSDRFEFADSCEELLPAYDSYIPTSDEVSEEAMLEVLQADAVVAYLSSNGNNSYKSLRQARAATDAKFSLGRKGRNEYLGITVSRDRHEQHKQDVKALPSKFPAPVIDLVDLSPMEQKAAERRIAVQKEAWIVAETAKLEQELTDDLDFVRAEYGQKVNAWQARALKAQQEVDREDRQQDGHEPEDRAA